jgi:flagellar M-ring protein FliF
MSEFFKQLLSQLQLVWQRLSFQQKIITSSIVGFAVLGLITLMVWSGGSGGDRGGVRALYSNLDPAEAAEITQALEQGGYSYKLANDGGDILVDKDKIYEIRMALAREGLPKGRGVGYELFDETNLGMTDFVQKINARRALEGELCRTIEGLEEVEAARIHVVIPEHTIFLDQQKDPKASVVIKVKSGRTLAKEQIRGISYLVSSSVEGLETDNISIVDFEGRLLSNPYADDATALASSRNMEFQQNIERYLERKAERMLTGVLGSGKASVQIAADLDFDQVEKTMELYDPESRVVRSEERNEENTKNAPDGDHARERSLTNYEIDKTIEHVVREVGNIKRLSISVAIDGKLVDGDDGEPRYEPRAPEELLQLEDMVKSAVGYDLARGDQISVANVRFDNEFLRKEQEQFLNRQRMEFWLMVAKYVGIFLIAVLLIVFLRSVARTLAEAMNPPLPAVQPLGPEDETPVEVPDNVRKTNEILERVEMMTNEEPVNIASIIREWLQEPSAAKKTKQ